MDQKKVKITLLFLLSLVLSCTLLMTTGCNKTDENISSEEEIKFIVGSESSTKTAYTQADKSLQLIWITGDQVSIFCEQAAGEGNKKKADYDVTPDATTPKNGKLSIAETDNIGLRWGSGNHNLYAIYPTVTTGGNLTKESEEGVFTFNFPKIQYCSSSMTEGYKFDSGNKHVLKPDMNLAYMVAKREGITPTSEAQALHFKPIATTLEITLKASGSDVVVSGLDIDVKVNTTSPNASNNDKLVMDNGTNYQIKFDAKQNYSSDVSAALVSYSSGVSTAKFQVRLGGGNYTIADGKSVAFTVFLPPIKNLDDVTVKCIGDNGTTVLGKKTILSTTIGYASPASKSFMKLPPLPGIKLVIEPNGKSISVGDKLNLKATVYFSNGDTKDVTNEVTWSSDNETYATVGDTSSDKGLVTGKDVGTATITANFNGITGTALVYVNLAPPVVFEDIVLDYYQWDAYEPYNVVKKNGPWGVGSAGYNTGMTPSQSCKEYLGVQVASYDEMKVYVGNGVYYDNGEETPYQQTYTIDGTTYHKGLWVKKWEYCDQNLSGLSTTPTAGRPNSTEIEKYFFLPVSGRYGYDGYEDVDVAGYYWLSTPNFNGVPGQACYFNFNNKSVSVGSNGHHRSFGLVPMRRL